MPALRKHLGTYFNMVANNIPRSENNKIDWPIVDKRPVLRTSCVFDSSYTTSQRPFQMGCTPQETNCVLFLITMQNHLCCSEKLTFLILNQ